LDTLKTHSDRIGLQVNVDESKVVVYRNGAYLAKREKWHIGNEELDLTTEYKYLGIVLSTKLCTNTILTDSAGRAKAGAIRVTIHLRCLSQVTPDVFFRVFEAQIQPMFLCSSEYSVSMIVK